MQKIIISGCNGHMGRVVAELCEASPDLEITAGFDVMGAADREFPVFTSPAQFTGEADAVIDFSSPAALDGLLEFAKATKIPLVLATTGYSPEQVAQIGAAALEVPIFRSGNMSPSGTALMIADAAAQSCGHETEYIFERHSARHPRDKKEIGISAVRGGTIVGEHEIIFAGHDEIMEIKHTALSREIFAQGAVEAAKFIAGVEQPGLYDMSYLVK